ncbi:glycine--tRNA ligase subunit beta [bacterium]|nr:glycine--tRNA ligase subunit beta [bacterium]
MPSDLFLEIGTEEIPARFLPPAMDDIARILAARLSEARLDHGEVRATATPRRLAVVVREVAGKQRNEKVERLGPPWANAFDAGGNPTPAAAGFAKGQGIDPKKLIRIDTDKGPRAGVRRVEKGQAAKKVLPELLTGVLGQLPWPKSMRWGFEPTRFVRPIHWIVALYGTSVVPFTFAGMTAGKKTQGHRFHAPKPFAVKDFDDWLARLRDAHVVADFDERREAIERRLREIAIDRGGRLVPADDLLTHVAGLVEYPVLNVGAIPAVYMDLPRDVLITPMRAHQKYFCFENHEGDLLPNFVAVGNTDVKDAAVVRAGYERVLNARLADARFFFEEDLKTPLASFADRLSGITFHQKIGDYKAKVLRAQALAEWLAERVEPEFADKARRAMWLAKADLLTQMVGEFPELQGTMGREYALRQGEDKDVAAAIFEHYQPRNAADTLPASPLGAICAVADKMETLASCLGAGLAPTGAGDPYGLRRQALGVAQILLERGWDLDVGEICAEATRDRGRETLAGEVFDFLRGRVVYLLGQRDVATEIAEAALAARFSSVADAARRAQAIAWFAKSSEYEAFATAFKRVANIAPRQAPGPVDPAVFEDEAEQELWGAFQSVRESVDKAIETADFPAALVQIARIRPQVDRFFDKVLVMHKDERLKTNRLSMLASISRMFAEIADFRRL